MEPITFLYNLYMTNSGFEYKNKRDETPFETFLRYSDQKKKSASKLAAVLQQKLDEPSSILDIGTGNGEYLELALSEVDPTVVAEASLTLIEPSDDLVTQLSSRFTELASDKVRVIKSDLQTFKSNDTFDVILMSHLFYHIPKISWKYELSKALSLLKKNGVLIIVLREKDDAYDFKMEFKSLLSDKTFNAVTIDDVTDALPQDEHLHIERLSSFSELHIPTETSVDDTLSIIEFYLNKEWADIPPHIQQQSLDFIKEKENVFKQVDGIAVISINS